MILLSFIGGRVLSVNKEVYGKKSYSSGKLSGNEKQIMIVECGRKATWKKKRMLLKAEGIEDLYNC